MKRLILVPMLVIGFSFAALAQQPSEQRAALTDAAIALDTKAAPALEARLRTQVLNGSDDSPVTNVKIAVKNVTSSFYTYVSGWATFYDSNAVRCGEGVFKLDALAPQESAEVDTPGLRLRCAPSTWRIVAPPVHLSTGCSLPLAPYICNRAGLRVMESQLHNDLVSFASLLV